jgi:predicted oxidoreductase (fatty acid repression mutant protein)
MNKNFYDVVKERRSVYSISKDEVLKDDEILSVIRHAVKYAPSAFNSQSARVAVLLGSEHDRLWDLTKETLRPLVPPKQFHDTEAKLDAFRSGYGTVLYFEDQRTVEDLQKRFSLYKDNFPVWSLESSGMLQYIIWAALESEGFGVSLQHYNPLIDDAVKSRWNIENGWKMLGEMPFGKPTAPADEKTFFPLDDRIKVFK